MTEPVDRILHFSVAEKYPVQLTNFILNKLYNIFLLLVLQYTLFLVESNIVNTNLRNCQLFQITWCIAEFTHQQYIFN